VGRGVQNYFENFSAYLCKSQEVPKMFFKNVIFWLKKSNFLKKMGSGESNTLSSRAFKKVWRAACHWLLAMSGLVVKAEGS
jgi:hypothetical protein